MGYHSCNVGILTTCRDPAFCQVGSLTGAVASKRVTEAPKGSLSAVGNRAKSAKAEGSLTARHTGRAGTKVGLSDPVVPSGRAIAQRIKATLGITGLYPPRVHIDGGVWHLDVGSSHPGAGVGPKGWAVRPLKRYASWVQNGCSPIKEVRELGSERRETVRSLSAVGVGNLRGAVLSTRGPGRTYLWCTSCSAKGIAG